MKILSIEDDAGIQAAYRAIFRTLHYPPAHFVTSISDAMEVLLEYKFDLITLDLGLLDSSPNQTVSMLGTIWQYCGDGALLVCTGYGSMVGADVRSLSDGVLLKPFGAHDFEEKAKSAIESARRRKKSVNFRERAFGLATLLGLGRVAA